jgi:hypothetical protein
MIRPRKTLRRGEPSKAEKETTRIAVRDRAHCICESQTHPECSGQRILPLDGDLWRRGHLAHGRGKARFGWRESEEQWLSWCCSPCHLISEHQQGVKLDRPDRPILKVEGFDGNT